MFPRNLKSWLALLVFALLQLEGVVYGLALVSLTSCEGYTSSVMFATLRTRGWKRSQ